MHRTLVFARLAFCAALGVPACNSPDPPPATFSPVCLHYAGYTTGGQCGNPALPAAEVARVTPRWAQHCEDVLAMPGSTVTAQALDKCLTVLEAGGCWSINTPTACIFSAGTLPAGSSCNESGVQCQSGGCTGPPAQAPCGTCLPSVAVGQTCDQQVATNICTVGSTCLATATSASCTAVTLGALGAGCGTSSDCASGLVCDPAMLMCAAPPGAGSACSDPFGCSYPLVCNVNVNAGTTCQSPGGAGAPCLTDEFCAKPLGCSMANGTCGVVSWQSAGQSCDGDMARCLVGTCPTTSVPVCPTVLKDGASCAAGDETQTCDAGAVCFGGKCVLGTSVMCP